MKKLEIIYLKIALFVISVVIVILSSSPNSTVLRSVSMNENGVHIITPHYYSLFNQFLLDIYNFGPFLSAVMACIMIVVMITMFFVDGIRYKRFALVMSVIGLVVSLFSLIISIFCNSSLVMKKQAE